MTWILVSSETLYDKRIFSRRYLNHAQKLKHLDLLLTDGGLPRLVNGISLAAELKQKFQLLKLLFLLPDLQVGGVWSRSTGQPDC